MAVCSLLLSFLLWSVGFLAFEVSFGVDTFETADAGFLEEPEAVFFGGFVPDFEVLVDGVGVVASDRGVMEGLEEVSISEGREADKVLSHR